MGDDQPFSVLYGPKDNPALVTSGYAKIARYTLPALVDAGYEVLVHATVGHSWNTIDWSDPKFGVEYPIVSGGEGTYGEDAVPAHMDRLHRTSGDPPVYLFCGDVEGLNRVPEMLRRGDATGIAWSAVDWMYPSPDHHLNKHEPWLMTFPMSGAGEDVLRRDGLGNLAPHVPLGVDPGVFRPLDVSEFPATMESIGFREDTFNVAAVFANQWLRKGAFEMLAAVGEFAKRHPEADIRFYGHTQVKREWDMEALVDHLGLWDRVELSNDYEFLVNGYTEEQVAKVLNCADVVLSVGHEGFGLQTIEAQACGTPVIGLNAGATPELVEYGILVPAKATLMWPQLSAKKVVDEAKILEALEAVYEETLGDPAKGVEFVRDNYTWDHTARELLARLEAAEDMMVERESLGPPDPGPRARELEDELVVVD